MGLHGILHYSALGLFCIKINQSSVGLDRYIGLPIFITDIDINIFVSAKYLLINMNIGQNDRYC